MPSVYSLILERSRSYGQTLLMEDMTNQATTNKWLNVPIIADHSVIMQGTNTSE